MRRAFALAAAVGLIAAGIGCKHVAGVCDCATSPDNAALPPVTNPYPVVGNVVSGGPAPTGKMEKMEQPKAPGK